MLEIRQAANIFQDFIGNSLTVRVSSIESALQNKTKTEIINFLENQTIGLPIIESAFSLKSLIKQIYVVIHSVGILLTLPKILNEDERVEKLSLGAGNTGRKFDVETSYRIAEFKFINWQGGPESIRQNSLFKDFYLLAESPIQKVKELYVIGMEIPLQFLNGGRSIESVLSHNRNLHGEFRNRYQDQYTLVRDYYNYRIGEVKLINLLEIIPEINELIEIEPTEDI